uniref:ODAD1 central coiled coil region domain-containing protein n=1 Tax=Anser brachyrhynchus TaxID=132585 RepID=A0A8B9IA79_9AVES
LFRKWKRRREGGEAWRWSLPPKTAGAGQSQQSEVDFQGCASCRLSFFFCRKEIESLKEEHRGMSLTLSQISSLRNVMQDDRNRMELKCLLQTKDQYDCLIRDRKALLAEQDSQVRASEQVPGRAQYSRAEPWNEFTPVRKKHLIQALEYKAASHGNHHQKSVLVASSTLQRALLCLAQQLSTCRVEALARISAMNERHSKDTVQYNVEVQERERIRHQENKLKTFVLAKFTDRSELEEEAKKKEALKAARKAKQRQGESFESREVAYKRLLELAENGDIDQLANGFIEKEGKNFAYFSYATELNNETEKLQQRIKDLQVCFSPAPRGDPAEPTPALAMCVV